MATSTIKLNPKQWITDPHGRVLMTHRAFDAYTAAGCYSLIGGTNQAYESEHDAAARLLRHRVGLEVETTALDRWWQVGLSGQTSIRSLYVGQTDATTDDLAIGDETIQAAAFFPRSQVARMARKSVTDTTLVAMCRMMPELLPPIPDDLDAVLFDLGALAGIRDRDLAEAEVAAEFGVDTDVYHQAVEQHRWPVTTGMYGDLPNTVRQLAVVVQAPRGHHEHNRLTGAWVASHQMAEYTNATTALDQLHSRSLLTGLVADGNHAEKWNFDQLPVAGLIDRAVWSVHCGRALPDPELFRVALRDLGVSPSRCLYVTNRSDGITGAAAAGIAPVQLGHLAARSPLDPLSSAVPVIDSLDRVVNLLP